MWSDPLLVYATEPTARLRHVINMSPRSASAVRQDAGDVVLHGLEGDAEGAGDLLVAGTFGQQVEDLAFPGGQVVCPGRAARAGQPAGCPGEELAGDSRAEGGAARGDGAQCRGDLAGGRALEDVAACARGQRIAAWGRRVKAS